MVHRNTVYLYSTLAGRNGQCSGLEHFVFGVVSPFALCSKLERRGAVTLIRMGSNLVVKICNICEKLAYLAFKCSGRLFIG